MTWKYPHWYDRKGSASITCKMCHRKRREYSRGTCYTCFDKMVRGQFEREIIGKEKD